MRECYLSLHSYRKWGTDSWLQPWATTPSHLTNYSFESLLTPRDKLFFAHLGVLPPQALAGPPASAPHYAHMITEFTSPYAHSTQFIEQLQWHIQANSHWLLTWHDEQQVSCPERRHPIIVIAALGKSTWEMVEWFSRVEKLNNYGPAFTFTENLCSGH